MSAQQLIVLLREIVAESTIEAVPEEDMCLNWGLLEERHSLIQKAANMATEVLVKPDGDRNISAEIDLENAGFFVRCLEKDGFGWLTGGIETEKGIISYG
jgi:hypothetical protein